jgi:molybdopterin-guanine dinucleotide biosynthesis protein A
MPATRSNERGQPVVGVLLAGGRASRFGGGDTCLLPLAGRPLLVHAIERLRPQVDTLILNANGDPGRFANFGLPVAADTLEGNAGPLAGVLAGMEWALAHRLDARSIVSVATDTPFFPEDLVARMMQATGGSEDVAAVASSEAGTQPVFGLWPVRLAPALRAQLQSGKRKVLDWAIEQEAAVVPFAPVKFGDVCLDPFFNINTPKDLAATEALLAR